MTIASSIAGAYGQLPPPVKNLLLMVLCFSLAYAATWAILHV